MKPVDIIDLIAVVGRAEQRITAKRSYQQLDLLFSNIRQPDVQRIGILHKNEYLFVTGQDYAA